jgi:tetratricopeptide (TPR) repeat protein
MHVALFLIALIAADADVGVVAFANSGAPAAQADFLHGLALLHNFEYPEAAESFKKAQKIDPDFAMAYWGEAMTYTHPIWMQQDLDAARAALKRLSLVPRPKTDRERAYLRTVEVLYGEGTKKERDFKYADAMAALHERYPEDVDATAFYALSLLGTAHEGRDFATYMRAAALLEEVFPTHQHHPGVLHYLIHSYDDVIHAPLGLRAARLYGSVAPKAPHALHMTSHIFIAMGMWDEVIDANRRAIAAQKIPSPCGHYSQWLEYAYLQEKRVAEAKKMLDECQASAVGGAAAADPFSEMRVLYITSGGGNVDPITIPDAPAWAKFTIAYGDALTAAQRRDADALNEAAARLRALQKEQDDKKPGDRERVAIVLHQVEALQLSVQGKKDEAIALLQKAAAEERAMPFEFGPPSIEKPTFELLADELLAAGRAADAEKAYRTALERTPGRTPAVEGLQRAQKLSDVRRGALSR